MYREGIYEQVKQENLTAIANADQIRKVLPDRLLPDPSRGSYQTTVITDPDVDTSHCSYEILVTAEDGTGGINTGRVTITYESPLAP